MSDIDFSSISSIYSQYIADSARTASSAASGISTNADYTNATDDELMDVCKQFEAYFLEQCLKKMTETLEGEEYSSSSTSTLVDYFKDEMIQEVAAQSTKTNSLGLAQMLYEQMKRNYD